MNVHLDVYVLRKVCDIHAEVVYEGARYPDYTHLAQLFQKNTSKNCVNYLNCVWYDLNIVESSYFVVNYCANNKLFCKNSLSSESL